MIQRFLSIRKASKTLGLSAYYLRELLKEGKLPHVKCGVKTMVDVPKLLTQLETSGAGEGH